MQKKRLRRPVSALILTWALLLLLTGAPQAHAAITFRWMGVSGFTLTDGKSTLLFDPAVTPTPLASWILPFQKVTSDTEEFRYWAKRCDITRLDATFVNHTHTDHAIDAPTAVQLFGGLLAGSSSLKQIGLGHGLPEESLKVMQSGDTLSVGDFQVQALSTPHSPHFLNILLADGDITQPLRPGSSPWDYRVGQTFSYWVTHPEGKILFQAPGRVLNPDLLENFKPDTLLLTIANRVSSDQLIEKRIKPSQARKVIPLHWDQFFFPLERSGPPRVLWFQKPEEFAQRFETSVTRVPSSLGPRPELIWPEYCKPIAVGH